MIVVMMLDVGGQGISNEPVYKPIICKGGA